MPSSSLQPTSVARVEISFARLRGRCGLWCDAKGSGARLRAEEEASSVSPNITYHFRTQCKNADLVPVDIANKNWTRYSYPPRLVTGQMKYALDVSEREWKEEVSNDPVCLSYGWLKPLLSNPVSCIQICFHLHLTHFSDRCRQKRVGIQLAGSESRGLSHPYERQRGSLPKIQSSHKLNCPMVKIRDTWVGLLDSTL